MALYKYQKKAVTYRLDNLLVLAGPGSGKTTVLTNRIQYLVEQEGIKENNILVLTFTKAAAEEMQERYLRLTKKSKAGILFGTFHSVFLSILKKYYQDFRIVDREEEAILLKDSLTSKHREFQFTNDQIDKILDDISRMKNGLKPVFPNTPVYYQEFNKICDLNSVLNFDDILVKFANLLVDEPELLENLRERYNCILIDEFQDINRIQYEIIRSICGQSGTVFAVGDDDQSIYGFRGSSPEFMRRFLKEFRNAKSIVLNKNYRSTGAIVKSSLHLISKNKNRMNKYIHSMKRFGLFPEIYGFSDLSLEAAYIEKKVSEYISTFKKELSVMPSIAVLSRTNIALEEIKHFISPDVTRTIDYRTFHSSKGLEYDIVFISHMNEDVTPGKSAVSLELLEEERRAFYVAITRCKSYLHIFYTSTQYNSDKMKSRFVDDLSSIFFGGLSWKKN